jgi:hypothetical protein
MKNRDSGTRRCTANLLDMTHAQRNMLRFTSTDLMCNEHCIQMEPTSPTLILSAGLSLALNGFCFHTVNSVTHYLPVI